MLNVHKSATSPSLPFLTWMQSSLTTCTEYCTPYAKLSLWNHVERRLFPKISSIDRPGQAINAINPGNLNLGAGVAFASKAAVLFRVCIGLIEIESSKIPNLECTSPETRPEVPVRLKLRPKTQDPPTSFSILSVFQGVSIMLEGTNNGTEDFIIVRQHQHHHHHHHHTALPTSSCAEWWPPLQCDISDLSQKQVRMQISSPLQCSLYRRCGVRVCSLQLPSQRSITECKCEFECE